MHIVFVTTELATSNNSSGGLASFTANIARIFVKNGHKVTIILSTLKETGMTFDDNISLKCVNVEKKVWKRFNKASFLFSEKAQRDEVRKAGIVLYKSRQVFKTIKMINRKENVDFVHYCNLGALAFWANKKIPYCIRVSGFVNMGRGANTRIAQLEYNQNPLTLSEKLAVRALKKAKYVISPSFFLRDIIKEEFEIQSFILESPFVMNKNEWDYRDYDSKLKGKRYLIHYGSLKYLKGTHVVAELAEELLQRYQDLYIVLAGNSEEMVDSTGKTIKAHKLVEKYAGEYANRVIYVGRLVREQLYPIIQNAELCLLPSRIENLSNACIEAMAIGKIVVATDGASYEQLIENRISGFLCERDNSKSFLQGINEALSLTQEKKEEMGAKAIAVTERLNSDNIYKKYLDFYRKVINQWQHI